MVNFEKNNISLVFLRIILGNCVAFSTHSALQTPGIIEIYTVDFLKKCTKKKLVLMNLKNGGKYFY